MLTGALHKAWGEQRKESPNSVRGQLTWALKQIRLKRKWVGGTGVVDLRFKGQEAPRCAGGSGWIGRDGTRFGWPERSWEMKAAPGQKWA